MKLIGRGYYYNVYDLGDGRVRKIPRSSFSQIAQLVWWYAADPLTLVKEISRAPYSSKQRTVQFEISRKLCESFPGYFGNPSLFDGGYEQDKAVPLGDAMKHLSREKFLERCIEYVKIVHLLWQQGIGDEVFNFTLNAGIDAEGKLIIMDTNEFTFDKDRMKQELSIKRYLKASSFKKLPGDLKRPVREIFEREFAVEKLDELWEKRGNLTYL